MAASPVKYNYAVYGFLALCNFNSNDVIKMALYTSVPAVTTQAYTSTGETSNGNGYTTGGVSLGTATLSGTSGTTSVNVTQSNANWTSSTGTMTLRYMVIYDDTTASKYNLLYWDYGSSLVLQGANGDTFSVTFSTANVPFSLT